MTEVILHIYDVTNSGSEKSNSAIVQINKIFKDGIGLGGVFHSAVQACGFNTLLIFYGLFCTVRFMEKMNGHLDFVSKVNQIIRELSREWPGISYDLLSKNCNHFCEEFSERLGVPKLPGWVNLFANAGGSAMGVAENTAIRLRQARTEIVSASKVAYQFLLGVTGNVRSDSGPFSNSNSEGAPRFQATWFKNLITTVAKPSSGSEIQNEDESEQLQRRQEDDEGH